MKYISFLGVTRYSVKKYKEKDKVLEEKFFQKIILNRHKNELDELIIITTEKGLEKFEEMCSDVKPYYPNLSIKKIELSDDSDYEGLISSILENDEVNLDGEEVIIDVTHCYRSMPAKMLLALDYLEKNVNVKINHLYYGKEEKDNGIVIDFIKFYHESKIAESLRQFKETLKISNIDTINSENKKLNDLLCEMQSLNDYLELADYDNTKNCMIKIKDLSGKLMNDDGMKSLKYYLESIFTTFSAINKEDDDTETLKKIVRLLTKHSYFQLACTFVYKKYETWISNYLKVKDNGHNEFNRMLGDVSFDYQRWHGKIKYNTYEYVKRKKYNKILLNNIELFIHTECDSVKAFQERYCEVGLYFMPYLVYESCVYTRFFAKKIRNRLNHATKLEVPCDKLYEHFCKMIICINRLTNIGQEYDKERTNYDL